MRVYVCGAEDLRFPRRLKDGEIKGPERDRWHKVRNFLWFELSAMAGAGQLNALAFDPNSSFDCVIEHVKIEKGPYTSIEFDIDWEKVSITSALDTFKADYILAISPPFLEENYLPGERAELPFASKDRLSAVQILLADAETRGVIIRDAHNI